MDYDLIVIGGGASGIMAAIVASEKNKKVLIIEKNNVLGKKLSITGGGRCNITNAETDIHKLLAKYEDASKYLYTPFSKFGVSDTKEFFKTINIEIIEQKNNRCFPNSENAIDVRDKLVDKLIKNKVDIIYNSNVKKINIENKSISNIEITINNKKEIYSSKNYILATGGASHGETGSTGDGFKFLSDIGHNVKSPTPTIVPLSVKESWIKDLSGITLENVKIQFENIEKGLKTKKLKTRGNLLFTHFGVSGPSVLNASNKVADMLHVGEVLLSVDIFPDINEKELNEKIINLFDANKNKLILNTLVDIAPRALSRKILELIGIELLTTKVHSFSKENRKELIKLLKNFSLNINDLMGYERAVIADGGVNINEIDFTNMRSKIINNLYVTGDLLDIKRPSGGYSLQLCWTTGYIAGSNIN